MLHGSSRSRTKWLACLAATLLLFTQLAIAAAACMLTPGTAGVQPQAAAEAGCGAMPMDEGVCLARCAAGEQATASLDQHHAFVAPSHSIGATRFPLREVHGFARAGKALDVPRSPPLRILVCSYQT
jgi:hypothetical protein